MKRRHYILFAGVIVLTIIALKLPSRTATQVKLAIGSLFLPLFGLAGSAQQAAERGGNAIVPRGELLRQNEQFRRENAGLKVQLQRQQELDRENERLRAMLAFQKRAPWKLKAAHVIGRDPANWWRNVQIDLGRRDGLRPDLPVLTQEGLVGRISEVSETRARVVLLGDPNCRVSALVRDPQTRKSVDMGVIAGGLGVLDESMVELSYLSHSSEARPGHVVQTSGMGGIFPTGINIGQIVDLRAAEFGLLKVARVKLAVRLNLLEEVWVMMP